MRKKLTEQDECYTPKYFINYFGKFDYDPATTKEQSKSLDIRFYDTIETNGLTKEWNYKRIWINPPFSKKFEFLEKAVETYKKYQVIEYYEGNSYNWYRVIYDDYKTGWLASGKTQSWVKIESEVN